MNIKQKKHSPKALFAESWSGCGHITGQYMGFLSTSFLYIALLCSAALLLPVLSWADSPFYDCRLVATSGQTLQGFAVQQSIENAVSINDNGLVAFIANGSNGGQAIFVA